MTRVEPYGLTKAGLLEVLAEEVGCRVNAKGEDLQGLSLHEYASQEILGLPEPWDGARFRALAERSPRGTHLVMAQTGERVPGETLVAQAEHLQAHRGPYASWIGPLRLQG